MRGFLRPGRPNGKSATRSPGTDGDYKKIEPFQLGTPPPQQLSPHTSQQLVRSGRDVQSQQQSPTSTPIYDQQVQLTAVRSEKLSRRHSQTIHSRPSTDEPWISNSNVGARLEATAGSPSPSPLQAPPPVPESRTPSSLPPGAAHPATFGATVLGSHSNPQSPAGTQPPPQPWSNKLSKKLQTPTVNGIAPPPRANGHASGNSVQYSTANSRSGAESYDNGREGSVHSEDKDRGWTRGFFGSSREREREKEAQKELTRMIGGC
jgi:hypothetical protein